MPGRPAGPRTVLSCFCLPAADHPGAIVAKTLRPCYHPLLLPARTAKPRILAAIPARYGSTRFPGKALAALAGKPMVQHVYERVARAAYVDRVVVATDDARIVAAVEGFGGEARLTRRDHRTGSDRLAELVEGIECDLVVNVQGDEPLVEPGAIAQAIEPFFLEESLQVTTLKVRLHDPETLRDPNVVKVATDERGFAVNFFRVATVIPGVEINLDEEAYFKHLGLYVYTRECLLRFAKLAPSPGEEREKLEQLRLLEHGIPIQVV
ncbi:MAG: 3-deoxy-manno-octulosonate cytidylyltransferase, partial [Terriglobia bacterium]